MKVIFLAFANNSQAPLEYLAEEDDMLSEILSNRYKQGDYLIHRESFATPESINKSLNRYRESIAIFHYSGHAGQNKLLLNNGYAFAAGIANQLKHSANRNTLKLVVLNGCSTYDQVEILKECGIPAIISTNAAVQDKGAKEFSIRLWKNLVDDMPIEDAYKDAIGAAASVTPQDLSKSYERHLFTDTQQDGDIGPLWRLDCITENAIQAHPIPCRPKLPSNLPYPNQELIDTLYTSFRDAGNPEIVELHEREQNGRTVTDGTKQIAIVNSIPFPVGIHLQKLICPTAGITDEGYDSFGNRRLEQIGQLFQTATEFLGMVMIAQVWEIYIQFPKDFALNFDLKEKLNEYVLLDKNRMEVYDYMPLIKDIRKYMYSFKTTVNALSEFINNQEVLGDMNFFDENFLEAWCYLVNIRTRTFNNKINEDRVTTICIEAESKLCIFMKFIGFIHKYHLTSIQNIDILKLRHTERSTTAYKHRIIRCMQALGKDEWNYYYINFFLDNWGMLLLRCNVKKIGNYKYNAVVTDYLNLSPFIIDRNSFVDKADLADIMFFKGENENQIRFKKVKSPLNQRDFYEVNMHETEEDRFDAIRRQYTAFKDFISY